MKVVKAARKVLQRECIHIFTVFQLVFQLLQQASSTCRSALTCSSFRGILISPFSPVSPSISPKWSISLQRWWAVMKQWYASKYVHIDINAHLRNICEWKTIWPIWIPKQKSVKTGVMKGASACELNPSQQLGRSLSLTGSCQCGFKNWKLTAHQPFLQFTQLDRTICSSTSTTVSYSTSGHRISRSKMSGRLYRSATGGIAINNPPLYW